MACKAANVRAGFSLYTGMTTAVRLASGTSLGARRRCQPSKTPVTHAAVDSEIQPKVIANSTTMSHSRCVMPPMSTTANISCAPKPASAAAPPKVRRRARRATKEARTRTRPSYLRSDCTGIARGAGGGTLALPYPVAQVGGIGERPPQALAASSDHLQAVGVVNGVAEIVEARVIRRIEEKHRCQRRDTEAVHFDAWEQRQLHVHARAVARLHRESVRAGHRWAVE